MKVEIQHTDYGCEKETIGAIVEATPFRVDDDILGYDILGSELNIFRPYDEELCPKTLWFFTLNEVRAV